MVTKDEIEAILTDYGVTFTDALADRLLEYFMEHSKNKEEEK